MFGSKTHRHTRCLAIGGISFALCATMNWGWPELSRVQGQEAPDIQAIIQAGQETSSRLKRESAAWTAEFEWKAGGRAFFDVISSPEARRVSFFVDAGSGKGLIFEFIERNDLWFFSDNKGDRVYRPYEAKLPLAALYSYLERSNPRMLTDASAIAGFQGQEGSVATFRARLDTELSEFLNKGLDVIAEEGAGSSSLPQDKTAALRSFRDLVDSGFELKVDTETGIWVQHGAPGQRAWIRNFRWLEPAAEDFGVAGPEWEDCRADLFVDALSRDDLVMIRHAPGWRPGKPARDGLLLLFNINSGASRRVPFRFGVAQGGCFSKDRSKVFVSEIIGSHGNACVFEIDLETGENRNLGSPLVDAGVLSPPRISPNGKSLALQTFKFSAETPFVSQIHVMDIASGDSHAIGPELEVRRLAWQPSGKALILQVHRNAKPDASDVDMICRMTLDGALEEIRPGESPVVLPDSRIFFRDIRDDSWKICNSTGQNAQPVGDGLPSHSFPTLSPDGRRIMLMRSGGEDGPKPCIVDLESGQSKMVPNGLGLWAQPVWQ